MAITRRDFLKISGITSAGVLFGVFDLKPIVAYAQANPPVWEYLRTSICCFCGCGCGLLVGSTWDGVSAYNPANEPYIQYVQGDPDHPINGGSLCSKGSATLQTRNVDGGLNPQRITQPMYRASGGTQWQTKTWAQILPMIGNKIATAHYNTFQEYDSEAAMTVNRCKGIAALGGAAHDNQECYLMRKLWTGLGLVYIDHQARI
jgi:formate dehydrogenase major subunit